MRACVCVCLCVCVCVIIFNEIIMRAFGASNHGDLVTVSRNKFLSLSLSSFSKWRLHAAPFAHSATHGLWFCDTNAHRQILVCKSKLSGHSWREVVLPGLTPPVGAGGSAKKSKWTQVALASGGGDNDNDDDGDLLWSLLQTNCDLVCYPTGESAINNDDRRYSSTTMNSAARSSSPSPSSSSSSSSITHHHQPPPWRLSIPDKRSSFSCVSASTAALWGLTPRGDVWVRAGMSAELPLGSAWRKLDMVQLGNSVVYLAVGKMNSSA